MVKIIYLEVVCKTNWKLTQEEFELIVRQELGKAESHINSQSCVRFHFAEIDKTLTEN